MENSMGMENLINRENQNRVVPGIMVNWYNDYLPEYCVFYILYYNVIYYNFII